MLPTFFVVGAAKAGTTSLFRYLNDHPNVYAPSVKEPFFFSFMNKDLDFKGPFDHEVNASTITNFDEYENLYCEARGTQERGDFSNSYLYFPRSAERIDEHVDDPKIIIMLRDPVRRAFSHYLQCRMLGHESRSFEEALALEEQRRAQNWRWHYQFREQSRYFAQVKTYLDVFGQQRVHIELFEDFVSNTRLTMRRLAAFLEIDADFYSDYTFKTYNATKLPKNEIIHRLFRRENVARRIVRTVTTVALRRWASRLVKSFNYSRDQRPRLDPETEEKLRREFLPDVEKLEDLIDEDLSEWK